MTTEQLDCSKWYTKQQAADAIHVSTKTIEQYAKDGKIQKVDWKRPTGGPRIAMYQPEDVNRLAHRLSEAFVVTASTPTNGNGHALAPVTAAAGKLAPVAAASTIVPSGTALLEAIFQMQKTAKNSEKLFLTIPEAAQFTGLTEAFIRRLCQTKKLGAIRDAGWKIPRARLLKL